MTLIQLDETAARLREMALTEAMAGQLERADLARVMYELYVNGHILVSFDNESGEPHATLRDGPTPVISHPWFASPLTEDVGEKQETQRQIGFQLN
jgi:hypothetical protein